MKVAITGGTGLVGGHLARRLHLEGHELVLLARGTRRLDEEILQVPRAGFLQTDLADPESLRKALAGCDAIAHFAGINREIGTQTYRKIHLEGTRNLVQAAKAAEVRKIVMMSFLRARPNCGSAYHESKWAAEELIRNSGLDYTILKSGMVYGRGDHMLDHLSHSLHTLPWFATVGFKERAIRPLAIDDLVAVLKSALSDSRLANKTLAITGAEQLFLSDAARRVARVLGRRIVIVPAPVWFHYVLAQIFEWTMRVPLIAKAQVRILSEGVVEAAPPCDRLPADLMPTRLFTDEPIREGLPDSGAFSIRDLRCSRA
jgi:uncharacterized protein YbjT (DUF2867 family)